MTEIDLLGNIGATFGLCVGLSLACLVQLFDMIVEIIRIFCSTLKKNNQKEVIKI